MASDQSTWANPLNRERLSASPHNVWFPPTCQACMSPHGSRTPSASVRWLDAATASVPVTITALTVHSRPPEFRITRPIRSNGTDLRILSTAYPRTSETNRTRFLRAAPEQ